ncbi:MAG TPA: VCBS repeat-containing protein [Bryobacteraceae bacterium]|nr:VCBS repeat-containing protein [Bryobacteraceae bacterium]
MKSTVRRIAILPVIVWCSLAGARAATPQMPTFFARYDYPAPSQYTNFVQVGDTNGDGIADLMVYEIPESLDPESGYVQVLFGNGNGTFKSGPSSQIFGMQSTSFTAADLNGDSKVDLAMTGYYYSGLDSYGVATSIGNGDGTFQPIWFYPIDDTPLSYTLVVGDFNGDGIPDIATPGSMGVWLLTGKGDGTFNSAVLAAPLPGESSSQIAAADFNGDHKLDLVVSLSNGVSQGGGFVVLLGNGNGTFQAPQSYSRPGNVYALAVGSLTKDGPPGIVLAHSYTTDVELYFGDGAGGFSGPYTVNLSADLSYFFTLAIGDVNGDGIPDLVSSNGYVAYGEGGGRFTESFSYPNATGTPANVVLTDLRNDGRTDIVTGGYYGVSVVLSDGNGKFRDGVWTSVTDVLGCGTTADFNGDGKPDLALGTAQGISILLGTGQAATPFSAGATIPLTIEGCPFSRDLNGDGIPDLLVIQDTAVIAYLGNGDGTFTLRSTTAIPYSGALALGDFNHDGMLDFATNGNVLALGNGDGTFQTPTPIMANPPASGFNGIAAGDINNDGWPDLVLTNDAYPVANNVYVMLNDQQGGFTQVPANFGANTDAPILVHLDDDGNMDLILTSGEGALVYLGDGMGGFTLQATLPPGSGIASYIADVNGDGIPDVLVPGYNTVAVYVGKGNATYEGPRYVGTGPSSAGLLLENLHGQPPGAGLPDIVSPDGSGGVRVLINLTK